MRKLICLAVLLLALEAHPLESQQAADPQKASPPTSPIQQSIQGTKYENKTAHFTLTVPKDWQVSDLLASQVPGVVGTLMAPGGSAAIMVQRYYVPGPKVGAEILDSRFRAGTRDYRKLAEGPLKIDGRDSYFFIYRALFPFGPPEENTFLPAKLMVVLIPDGQSVLGFLCQAPEVEFEKTKLVFDKILDSYKSNKR